MLMFSGTPEEFLKISHLFGQPAKQELAEIKPEAKPGLTAELVEHALTRISLSPAQRKFFRIVLDAGTNGILASELPGKLGLTGAQYAGVTGALGRRFSNTPGWPVGVWPVSSIQVAGGWRYFADPALIAAMERGQIHLDR